MHTRTWRRKWKRMASEERRAPGPPEDGIAHKRAQTVGKLIQTCGRPGRRSRVRLIGHTGTAIRVNLGHRITSNQFGKAAPVDDAVARGARS